MKLVMKTLWLLLMKKKNIENSQRSDVEKITWLQKVTKLALITLVSAMKLLITV